MKLSNCGRLLLASLFAVNGIPVLTAPNTAPRNEKTVLSDWANALGMSGDLAANDEIAAIDYWATGTVRLNGALCTLTSYHVSTNYQVPGLRQEFTCVDASGTTHHEIQVVANRAAWNESGSGTTAAMSTRDARLVQLWSGPLALVKAAAAAGTQTRVTAEAGQTVVTFPVPGVKGATVKATLNAKHQADQVDVTFGATPIHTTYSDYVELNGSDLRFDAFFPRHIVQTQGGVTIADLTVTKTSTGTVDLVRPVLASVAATTAMAAPMPPNVVRQVPSTWTDKKSFGKLDENLRQMIARGCDGSQSVIVRTAPGYRAGLRASLTSHGDPVTGEFASINAVGANVSCRDLQTLAGFTSTLSVSVNAKVTSTQLGDATPVVAPAPAVDAPEPIVEAPAPIVEAPTSIVEEAPAAPVDLRAVEGDAAAALQAPMLQTLLGDNYEALRHQEPVNGSIGIAIIDSGIEAGPDFGDRITAFFDFTDGSVQAAEPSDAYGHGTHVAGLAASRYVGVNPNARLIGLKVLDGRGQGDSLNVLRAIEFAMENKDALDIQVLNISLGHPVYEPTASDPLVQAVESATRSGLIVVVSAGNFGLSGATGQPGYAGVASPGNAPSAFSVGAVRTFNTATRDDDRIAQFSSRGPTWYDGLVKPDFSAPGQNLLSVAAEGSTLLHGAAGHYMRLSGTSMAAGVVSGMAALVLQTNRGLTPNAVKALFEYSAINVNTENYLTQGAGSISGGAIALAQAIDSSLAVGDKWLMMGLTPETVIDGVAQPWLQRMVWGNHVARGAGVIDEQRPAFAASTVWGEGVENNDAIWTDGDGNTVWGNGLDADNIVWGNNTEDNIVWGNALDADDNIVWGNNIVWANNLGENDNIVWGNGLADDNIVWGNNVVWGNTLVGLSLDDNIVWGNLQDNIVWGNLDQDNIVWGNLVDDGIVRGNSLADDNLIWGNSVDELGAAPTLSGNGGIIRKHRVVKGVN